MREYSTAQQVAVPSTGNLTDDVVTNGTQHPESVVFSRRGQGDTWTDVTAAEFLADVRAVAKGLVAAGIEAGDRVALISRTRYEWTLLDYAIWFAGAATVPVYETSSADQIEWILTDSGAARRGGRDPGAQLPGPGGPPRPARAAPRLVDRGQRDPGAAHPR